MVRTWNTTLTEQSLASLEDLGFGVWAWPECMVGERYLLPYSPVQMTGSPQTWLAPFTIKIFIIIYRSLGFSVGVHVCTWVHVIGVCTYILTNWGVTPPQAPTTTLFLDYTTTTTSTAHINLQVNLIINVDTNHVAIVGRQILVITHYSYPGYDAMVREMFASPAEGCKRNADKQHFSSVPKSE